MSGPSITPLRLQSWIPSSFAWSILPDIFCIDVQLSDPDVVEFLSTGVREVTVHGTKTTAQAFAALIGKETLRGQMEEAVWAPAKLKPTDSRMKPGTKVFAYCYGVFLLPDEKTLSVLVGRTKPGALHTWIAASLKVEADALLEEHQVRVAEFDERIRLKKQENDAFKERFKTYQNFGAWGDAMAAIEEHHDRPTVTVEPLLPSIDRKSVV